ncbi:hypothetical protein AB205_0050560 [Aquarana catesbeiana]|uniref:Uncharacterized protein n=1 Tax=Aquarana catesbeiana TaxID=8400 RepID=A0A2G9RJL4_AQUCT|nr:hypothetical protein AB205_0050560 [Aquarana catesbeiana]
MVCAYRLEENERCSASWVDMVVEIYKKQTLSSRLRGISLGRPGHSMYSAVSCINVVPNQGNNVSDKYNWSSSLQFWAGWLHCSSWPSDFHKRDSV